MRFMTMLKALREEAKLTQQALAERAKVSKRSLEGWEQGRRVPRVTVLPQLAEALGVPLARLVEGVVNDRLETLGQSSRRGRKAKEK